MATNSKQIITFRIEGGVDNKSHIQTVSPGTFTEVENYSFDQLGALVKRDGYQSLALTRQQTGNPLTTPSLLATHNDNLVCLSDRTVWTWSPNLEKWCASEVASVPTVGTYENVEVVSNVIATSNVGLHAPVSVVSGNYNLFFYDNAPGSAVGNLSNVRIFDNTSPEHRLQIYDSTLGAVNCYGVTSSVNNDRLLWFYTNATSASPSQDTNFRQYNFSEFGSLGISKVHTGTLYWRNNGPQIDTDNLSLFMLHTSGTVWTGGTQPTRAAAYVTCHSQSNYTQNWQVKLPTTVSASFAKAMCVTDKKIWTITDYSNYRLFLAAVDKTTKAVTEFSVSMASTNIQGYNDSWESAYTRHMTAAALFWDPEDDRIYAEVELSQFVTSSAGEISAGSRSTVFMGYWPNLHTFSSGYNSSFSTGSLLPLRVLSKNSDLLARPFRHGDHVYSWVGMGYDSDYNTAFLLDEESNIVGRSSVATAHAPRSAKNIISGSITYATNLPTVQTIRNETDGTVSYSFASLRQGPIVAFDLSDDSPTYDARPIQIPFVTEIVATFDKVTDTQEFAGNLFFNGSALSFFDGSVLGEAGFFDVPRCEPSLISGSALGTGSSGTGLTQWQTTYHYRDRAGIEWSSRPSTIASVEPYSFYRGVDLYFQSYLFTNRKYTYIKAWRTVDLNDTSGADAELIFQQAGSVTQLQQTYDYYVQSLLTDTTVTDATIATRPALYTVSGELPNMVPPIGKYLCAWDGRLVLAGDEQVGNKVWLSKRVDERTPPSFNESMYVIVGTDPQPVTAVGTVDNTLIVFKQRAIYTVNPGGPDNLGNGGTFPQPQRLSADVGCDQPKSVVETPLGLMFKSTKGIYLLDRSGTVVNVGAAVERRMENLTVSSAVVIPDKKEVRFTCSNALEMFVYDYQLNRWSTHTFTSGIQDSTVWQGRHVLLLNENQIWYETPQYPTDTPYYSISSKVTTGWINFAGALAGVTEVHRILLQGQVNGSATLNISVAYDFDDNNWTTYTVNSVNCVTPLMTETSTNTAVLAGVDLGRRTAYAIKIKINDTEIIPDEENGGIPGLQLTAIGLEVAVSSGMKNLDTAIYAI